MRHLGPGAPCERNFGIHNLVGGIRLLLSRVCNALSCLKYVGTYNPSFPICGPALGRSSLVFSFAALCFLGLGGRVVFLQGSCLHFLISVSWFFDFVLISSLSSCCCPGALSDTYMCACTYAGQISKKQVCMHEAYFCSALAEVVDHQGTCGRPVSTMRPTRLTTSFFRGFGLHLGSSISISSLLWQTTETRVGLYIKTISAIPDEMLCGYLRESIIRVSSCNLVPGDYMTVLDGDSSVNGHAEGYMT